MFQTVALALAQELVKRRHKDVVVGSERWQRYWDSPDTGDYNSTYCLAASFNQVRKYHQPLLLLGAHSKLSQPRVKLRGILHPDEFLVCVAACCSQKGQAKTYGLPPYFPSKVIHSGKYKFCMKMVPSTCVSFKCCMTAVTQAEN